MKTVAVAPSSGLSGHLLPVGVQGGAATGAFYTFSPTGRRWPEGSDEGAPHMPKNDVTKRRSGKTTFARHLRHKETEEEYNLWSDLRARRLNGFKFTRQIPLGPYIVDFVCRERQLVVEIDGFHHAESRNDAARTAWLNAQGYSVLRFWNHDISKGRTSVLETILAALDGALEVDPATGFYSPVATIKNRRESDP